MDESDNKIIDLGARLRRQKAYTDLEVSKERIRNLAYQAVKLPSTLSRSEIEELGLAILVHDREHTRIV